MKNAKGRTKSFGEKLLIPPPDKSVGYLIYANQRLLFRALQTQVAGHEVPAGTWIFLRTIWEEDGLTQREISERAGIQEAATGSALDKLERFGLLKRIRNGVDRRKINIFLTDRGRKLGRELIPKSQALTEELVAEFQDFEVAQLCSYLTRVRANLRAILARSATKAEIP